MKSVLRKKLSSLAKTDKHRFHMPGHKGRLIRPIDGSLDVTEIDGSDNLHDPKEILRTVEENIATVYGASTSFLLVGGSTAGVIASILAMCKEGEKILLPENAHRSAYAALSFGNIEPVFYHPVSTPYGSFVTKEQVDLLLSAHPDVKGILVVSPDYAGTISRLDEISQVVHEHGKKLIVDEAHGAHLSFTDLPDAVSAGADYVIQSTHKTLSALTQSSVLHIREKKEQGKLRKLLSMIESSSPSYLQMISIEEAVEEAERDAKGIFSWLSTEWERVYRSQTGEEAFSLVKVHEYHDPAKWLFHSDDGFRDANILKRYGIEAEIVHRDSILLMAGIHTSQEDLKALFAAVEEINRFPKKKENGEREADANQVIVPESRSFPIKPGSAVRMDSQFLDVEDCLNRISAGFVIPYPPGIPYLIPGERISKESIGGIKAYVHSGAELVGIEEHEGQIRIEVVEEYK